MAAKTQRLDAEYAYPQAYGWLASSVDLFLRGWIDRATLAARLRTAEAITLGVVRKTDDVLVLGEMDEKETSRDCLR
jgi:hypothetical protein